MNKAQDSGFTLLELIVVMLIIALTIGLTFPSLTHGSASLHLKSCSRDVLNIFRYAREKAIMNQTGMMVTVDTAQQMQDGTIRQVLTLTNNLGDIIDSPYILPNDVHIARIALAGNEITNGSMTVRFIANGSADEAGVLLKSEYGSQLEVISDSTTGGGRIVSNEGANIR
jgi:prepilin-type N-terminal cleavage/methylation domain-containing protein